MCFIYQSWIYKKLLRGRFMNLYLQGALPNASEGPWWDYYGLKLQLVKIIVSFHPSVLTTSFFLGTKMDQAFTVIWQREI